MPFIAIYDNDTNEYADSSELSETDTFEISFYDERYEINVKKVDEENNYVNEAELAIYLADENGNYLRDVDDNKVMLTNIGDALNEAAHFITDGQDKTISGIPAGYYILSELTPPDNYMAASDIFFSVGLSNIEGEEEADTDIYTMTGDGDTITMTDKACGKISIYKTGSILTGYDSYISEFGSYISLTYEDKGLAGVTFDIYDTNMNIVSSLTTDENGYALSDQLPAGSYYLKESSAPNGYIIEQELKEIYIGKNEQEYSLNKDSFNLYNDYSEVSVNLLKMGMEENELTPLSDVVFALYNKNEYNQGEVNIPADTCLGYIVTDEEGYGSYKGRLPEGEYYIREIKAVSDYELDDTDYEFTVSLDNKSKEITININEGEPIVNYRPEGHLLLYKKDKENEKNLAGAMFSVYSSNDDKEICRLMTDENGKAEADLPLGSYYIIETKAPDGYILDTTRFDFVINEDIPEYEITLYNDKKIKLGVNEWWFTGLGIAAIIFILTMGSIFVLKAKEKKHDNKE
jgi:hypothetical protein